MRDELNLDDILENLDVEISQSLGAAEESKTKSKESKAPKASKTDELIDLDELSTETQATQSATKQESKTAAVEKDLEEEALDSVIEQSSATLHVVGRRRGAGSTKQKSSTQAEKLKLIEQLKTVYPLELFEPSKIEGIHYKYQLEGDQIHIVNARTGKVLKTISSKFRWLSPLLFQKYGYEVKDLVTPKPGMIEYTAVKDNLILVISDSYTPERRGVIRVIHNGTYKGMEFVDHDIIKFHKTVGKFIKLAQQQSK